MLFYFCNFVLELKINAPFRHPLFTTDLRNVCFNHTIQFHLAYFVSIMLITT